jgi:arabinosyltransferase C
VELSQAQRKLSVNRFAFFLAIAIAIAAALPAIINTFTTPAGSSYLGYVYNTDDHMVYAAWMRQAMDGHLLFDNRFTTDPQPGLTIHLYYFALGLVAKLVGIALAANLARVGFSVLFVCLLFRLIRRLEWDVHVTKIALVLPLISGGIGFLVWHTFGQAFVKPGPDVLQSLLLSRLPVDVWQPETFVFPSMLTNGLFMVSLCLITAVFIAILSVKDQPKAVLPGAACMFLLMNIHSYDVLLIAIVLVGFLVACTARREVTTKWVVRALLIGAGAVPPALYFMYVLKNDAVFQARAATETFSPNFRQVLFGLLFPVVLGLVGIGLRAVRDPESKTRRMLGLGLVLVLIVGMFVASANHLKPEYFMSADMWGLSLLTALVALFLLADENPAYNLFLSWAVLGMVAIYFPALFQRKLAIGLAIPWSVVAAYGLSELLRKQERGARNLITALTIIVFGASSVRWASREIQLASANVSNTSVHPAYLSGNVRKILDYLNHQEGRNVVIALPGIPSAAFDSNDPKQESASASELQPILPDLNPIVSGLTGAYTYAGHWSETPEYNKKRALVTALFLNKSLTNEERAAGLKETGANFVLAPTQESLPGLDTFDFRQLGEVVVDGPQFRLIRLSE